MSVADEKKHSCGMLGANSTVQKALPWSFMITSFLIRRPCR